MSRSNFHLKYWSQFINHEILTISGIRWYIANVLMRCGFVSSVDEVLNRNHSEYLTSYVDKEAIRIYQTATTTQDMFLLKSWTLMALIHGGRDDLILSAIQAK
jgi:hypothetical protein